MIIGLASPAVATSLDHGLRNVDRLLADAAALGAELVCFPEAYLPGLRGLDFAVADWSPRDQERAIAQVSRLAKTHGVATIMGMEHITDEGRQIAAYVFDADGALLGFQAKCQLDPTEEHNYVPGDSRQVFEVGGVKFGIAICHEGWRYPETVRWAAARGARIVFHPQHTGAHTGTVRLREWASPHAPYYEKAMVCRSIENAIWFASVNYALPFPESATALIAPDGECAAFLPYGQEGVLVHEIDVDRATGHLAARYAPERYRDATPAAAR